MSMSVAKESTTYTNPSASFQHLTTWFSSKDQGLRGNGRFKNLIWYWALVHFECKRHKHGTGSHLSHMEVCNVQCCAIFLLVCLLFFYIVSTWPKISFYRKSHNQFCDLSHIHHPDHLATFLCVENGLFELLENYPFKHQTQMNLSEFLEGVSPSH